MPIYILVICCGGYECIRYEVYRSTFINTFVNLYINIPLKASSYDFYSTNDDIIKL